MRMDRVFFKVPDSTWVKIAPVPVDTPEGEIVKAISKCFGCDEVDVKILQVDRQSDPPLFLNIEDRP